jgi:predicted nucleotidyltransferase
MMKVDKGKLETNDFAGTDCILRCIVGSTVHGLNITGADDIDEMGVCIEPPEYVIGLKYFEQKVSRTKPNGIRSGVGDKDSVIYSLRKWARLAVAGNPTILLLLFVPEEFIIEKNLIGEKLQKLYPFFISKSVSEPFLGYMQAQRQRLLGIRGQKRIKRIEYESEYGYDVKYAMHMLRLGFQGIEIMKTGRLHLPMKDPERGILRDVREGKYKISDVIDISWELEKGMGNATENTFLPDKPCIENVNKFLVEAYQQCWPRLERKDIVKIPTTATGK